MGNKLTKCTSNDIIDKKKYLPTLLDSGEPRVESLGSCVLPRNISRIVGEYSSEPKEKRYVENSLADKQPMTLCLSQYTRAQLVHCWFLGLLAPKDQWKSFNVMIDKESRFKIDENCVQLLGRQSSKYCPVVIDVLVVKLDVTSDFSGVLCDLLNTVQKFKNHVNSVKHVVISVENYASCCFTLKNFMDKEVLEISDTRSLALFQILIDLDNYRKAKRRGLTVGDLFDFYIKSKDNPPLSEKYLAKFVISLNHPMGGRLFYEEAYKMPNKIMWVTCLKYLNDLSDLNQDKIVITKLCHAFQLDAQSASCNDIRDPNDTGENVICFQDNPHIERILIDSHDYGHKMNLPRHNPLLKDTTTSALIELTLGGAYHTLHLTDLNNGYFQHLSHLCFIGGTITGHLDSDRVPSLKSLSLEPRIPDGRRNLKVGCLVGAYTQSLIASRRPWQLVASQKPGGWSLASYDEPALNPLNDEVNSIRSPHSQRHIRALLLVVSCQENADEWQSQLNGNPSLEAAVKDHKDILLEWKPQCVEEIRVFCAESGKKPQFKLTEVILEQDRILTSLTCYNVSVEVDPTTMPHLQSLELDGTLVKL